ncbi:MAG: DUF1549 domain-containing protein [Thermoguttaceae bacterium]|jgi:hypothetical protein
MKTKTISLVVLGLLVVNSVSAGDADPPKPAQAQPVVAAKSVFFLRDVMPLVNRLGCNSVQCHGSSLGQGGMALSMFGGDAEEDYGTIVKDQRGARVDRMEPAKSLLLLKVSGNIPHGGAQKIPPGSPEYKMLLSWIEQGAPYSDDKQPKLVSVQVLPREQVVQKGQTQQLSVTAVFSDGTKQDVTRLAAFQSTDAKLASVDADGKLKAEEFGSAAIAAIYLRHAGVVRIWVPQPLPTGFPAVTPNNKIDELVFANLKTLGFPPSEVASDDIFLRRVFFDVIGTPPTPEEARAFLADQDPQKRSKLIDRLLEREEFADFLATKWRDLLRIKAEEPISLWPKASETYYRWVRDSILQNKPYDQFVRELITGSGSNFRDGPSNYVRAVPERDPRTLGESTALVFLGARLNCARCHAHPVENWGEDDDLGMAAFFSQVQIKFTSEWKEQIVCRNPEGMLRHPKTGKRVAPKPLGAAALEGDATTDPRRKFADWLTAPENPWFAKNIVNRIWFWLLGRGIVHEPDDLRATNPPENPALLEYLEKELVGHHYDLKHIYRLVLNSKTYQLSSEPTPLNEKDAAHFSHYRSKRLTAEQILDGLSQIMDRPQGFRQFKRDNTAPATTIPADVKAAQIAEASETSLLAAMFGRPERGTAMERERADDINPMHVQFLANSGAVEEAIYNCARIQKLLKDKKNDAEVVDELFLLALARFPKEAEKKKMVEYLTTEKNGRDRAIHDILWTLLNTNEFLLNH